MSTVPPRPVVVGVDGSENCRRAVRWAADQAGRLDTSLRLVHCSQIPIGYPPGRVDWRPVRDALREQGELWLEQARDIARSIAPDLSVDMVLEEDDATAEALVRHSRHANQLVLGNRGLGGITGLLFRSTSVAVAAHAHSPVVVVRAQQVGDPPPAAGPVVVGVDGTPVGEAAIEFAFAEASRRKAELIAVHAWSDLMVEAAFAEESASLDIALVLRRAEETLAERLAGWQERYPDVPVAREVVRERPARALMERAEDARLVVVGSRGRGGFRGLLLGSTSQHLVHHAPCPVAVVRTPSH